MDKVNEYVGVKLVLGITALAVGMLALAFAMFGWSQAVQPLFGTYNRYICAFGSFGAIISGTLLINESFAIRKASLFHRSY